MIYVLALFALAFGWTEGVTVVYLRKLIGLEGSLDALAPASQEALFGAFARLTSRGEAGHVSPTFLRIEQTREAATILMLLAIAWLAGAAWRRRAAAFFLAFGLWDLAYYGTLWWLLRWPPALDTVDVLFLIPTPWIANVWIPALISVLFVAGGTLAYAAAPGRSRAPARRPARRR